MAVVGDLDSEGRREESQWLLAWDGGATSGCCWFTWSSRLRTWSCLRHSSRSSNVPREPTTVDWRGEGRVTLKPSTRQHSHLPSIQCGAQGAHTAQPHASNTKQTLKRVPHMRSVYTSAASPFKSPILHDAATASSLRPKLEIHRVGNTYALSCVDTRDMEFVPLPW